MNRVERWVRPNIRNLKPYSSARHEFSGTAHIYLDANENPYENGVNRYPDTLQMELKEELSRIKEVPVQNMFLGNGSDEAIDILIRIFCEPSLDEMITMPPTYGMYQVYGDINNVAIKSVPLTPKFDIDLSAVLDAITERTKIIWVCSPNNPTGNLLSSDSIEQIIKKFDGIVVVDEAYVDFTNSVSWASRIEEFDNLVVLQTMSKAWGMAGVRLGLAIANEYIISLYNQVKAPYNISIPNQERVLELLRTTDINEQVNAIVHSRDELVTQLRDLDIVTEVHPSDTNFLLVRFRDCQNVYDELVQRGIVLRNRNNVMMCENGMRVTIGRPDENNELVEALIEIMNHSNQ